VTDSRKELELLVSTRIKGSKDLAGVGKAIRSIKDEIKSQSEAAKIGENRIDELKGSLAALNEVQKELSGQSSAINYFQKLTTQIAASEEKVASATKRYDEYKKKLEDAGKRTDAQQQTLTRYSASLDRANDALTRQKAALSNLEADYNSVGISVKDLAQVQEQNLRTQAELGSAYAEGKAALVAYAQTVRTAREEQKKLDDATSKSTAALREFEAAERSADAKRAAREADGQAALQRQRERQNAIGAEVAANRRLDAEQAQQVKRAKELAALRSDIIGRSATTSALNEQAEVANKTAKSYKTLARASEDLRPKAKSLQDTIKGIVDPAAKARESLGGLETEVEKLGEGVAKIRGPVKDYQQQVEALSRAQKSIAQQANLIDAYSRQVAALRSARTAYVAAREDVRVYGQEVAKGGENAQLFASKLASAQNTLRQSASTMGRQVAATRESRQALRDAGIATSDLANEQTRLNNVARGTVSTLKQLEVASDKYGQAVKRTSRAQGLFRDEGRTTLSYLQRLRGEILSLIAVYGGLYTVIGTAKGAVAAASKREGVKNQLAISVGDDRAAIDAEYAYVKGQADRIGIEFERAITGYAKFSAAATLAGKKRQEIRYIYEAFSEVARVANLSADDLDGVFKALEQITSKGKIQAEELRGQLGDRLFGAFEVAAKALKDEFPNLDKAMKNGLITSEQLVRIAEEYRKTVANQLPAATKSLAAQQARLNNELFDFKLAVADSGFIESYSEALSKLTAFLRSDDGKTFASSVGKAFATLADMFIWLLDNIDLVKSALQIFFAYFAVTRTIAAANGIKNIAQSLVALSGEVVGAYGKIKTLMGAWPVLSGIALTAVGLITAAFAGWQIGEWARKKFRIVAEAGIWWVTRALEAFAIVESSYKAGMDVLPEYTKRIFNKIVKTIADAARNITGFFAKLAGAAGFEDISATLERAAASMNVGARAEIDVLSSHRENLKKELARIAAIREEMLADSANFGKELATGARGAENAALPTPAPIRKPTKGGNGDGPTDAQIKSRQSKIEAITAALEALEARIEKSDKETLASQIDAIDSQYAALSRKIEALGGETAKLFMVRLTAGVQALRKATTDKFNDALLKDKEALLKRAEDAEEQAGKRDRLSLQSRLAAITSDYEQHYRELGQLREVFVANNRDTGGIDAIKLRLDGAKNARLEQEKIKFNTEELNRREKLVNDTIAAREALLAAVNAQKEAGNIDDVEAAAALNAINAEMVPKIVAAGQATREWAIANSAIFDSPEAQQVFLATLDAVLTKTQAVKTEFSLLQQTIVNGGVAAINGSLSSMGDQLNQIAQGTVSVSEGFQNILQSFGQLAASFLRDIAIMIIKLQIFTALKNSGNPYLSAIGSAGIASVKHSGGIVGAVSNRTRQIDPVWFANAPRYHAGGLPGLSPTEEATVLEKGEEVLSKSSPRNILNGGAAAGGGAGQAGGGTRIVLVDDRSKVPEAMSGADGDRVIVQSFKRNIATFRQILSS
jgi:tape measure domain-containing protein